MTLKKVFYAINGALIVVIAVSAIFLLINLSSTPYLGQTPKGLLDEVTFVGDKEVRIRLTSLSQPVPLEEVTVKIFSPNDEVGIANLATNVGEYPQDVSVRSLNMISYGGAGHLEKGDEFAVSNHTTLKSGYWSIILYYEPTQGKIAEKMFFVP